MKRRRVIGLAAALACAALFASTPTSAQETTERPPPPPTITIEGSAAAAIVPDTATLSFGVVTTRPRASDAVAENSKALGDAIAAIKAEGIAPEAITTTALALTAVTDEPKTGAPKVVGYRARSQIEVRVPMSENVGKLTATLIDKGINTVDDLSFSSSEEEATRNRLRAEAAKTARHEAELYTSALGVRLGHVLGIRPGTMDRVAAAPPMVSRLASAPVPIEPGELRLTETVSVTFELLQ